MVARLIVDPDGAGTARTLAHAVLRLWPERERAARRQDQVEAQGWRRSVARPALARVQGVLLLQLSLNDRVWLQGVMSGLAGGKTLRVQPDSTVAGVYADVVLAGAELLVRYRRVWQGLDILWQLPLPVLVLDEVEP